MGTTLVHTFQEDLVEFNGNPKKFLHRVITRMKPGSVTNHFIHVKALSTSRWNRTKANKGTILDWIMVMATVFQDIQGKVFISYIEKGRTITSEYYALFLDRLIEEIRLKRPY